MKIEDFQHQEHEFSISGGSYLDKMEYNKSTPQKIHISEVYGISIYIGEPAFIYNDFYHGLQMDISDWKPFIKVESLYEHKCDLCHHEYTNRDFEVPENAGFHWVHSCPECDVRFDRTVEQTITVEKLKIQDAKKNSDSLVNKCNK